MIKETVTMNHKELDRLQIIQGSVSRLLKKPPADVTEKALAKVRAIFV